MEKRVIRVQIDGTPTVETAGICPTDNFNGEADGFAGNLPWILSEYPTDRGYGHRSGGEVYFTRPAPARYSFSTGIFQGRAEKNVSVDAKCTATFGHIPHDADSGLGQFRSPSQGTLVGKVHSADVSVFARMEELDDFDYWGETDEDLFHEGVYSGYEFCAGNTLWFDWNLNGAENAADLSAIASSTISTGGWTENIYRGSTKNDYSAGLDASIVLGDLSTNNSYVFLGAWNGTPGNASTANIFTGVFIWHDTDSPAPIWGIGASGWYTSNGAPQDGSYELLNHVSGDPSGLEFRVRLESLSEGPDNGGVLAGGGMDTTSPNYGRLRVWVGGVLVFDDGPGTWPDTAHWNTLTTMSGRYPVYVDGGNIGVPVSSGFSWTQIESGQYVPMGFCFFEMWTTRGSVPFFGGIDFMHPFVDGDSISIEASGTREDPHITCYANDTIAMDFDVTDWAALDAAAADAINSDLGNAYYSGGSGIPSLAEFFPYGRKGGVQMFCSPDSAGNNPSDNWTEETNRIFSLTQWKLCGNGNDPSIPGAHHITVTQVDR